MKTIALLVFVVSSCIAFSQEMQVPFDDEGKIPVLDNEINKKIQVITGYDNFKEALLFLNPDSTYTLEISYLKNGVLMKERKILNREEASELRQKVTALVKQKSPSTLVNDEGRTYYMIGSTGLGLFAYGWEVPVLFKAEDYTAMGVYCLSAAAGILIPYVATANTDVTLGSAHLAIYGGISGQIHGLLIGAAFDIKDEGIIGMMMLTSIAENIAGFSIAKNNNLSGGYVDIMTHYATLGTGYGFLTDALFEIDEDGFEWLPLLGSAAGYYVGNCVAKSQNYTMGDAMMASVPSYLSFMATTSVFLFFDEINPQAFAATSMITVALGSYLGNVLVKDKDFSTSQGVITELSSAAGMLIGSGLGYILSGKEEHYGYYEHYDTYDEELVFALGTVGAIAGYGLAYLGYKDDAVVKTENSTGSLDFNISPVGLIEGLKGSKSTIFDYRSVKPVSMPIATMTYTF